MENNKKPLMTTTEAVEETGASYYFIRRLISEGKIKVFKSGTRFYIVRSSLYEFLEGEKIQTAPDCHF